MAASFPYCQRAKDLIQELKRSDWLPAYNDDAIRAVIKEIEEINGKLVELKTQDINAYACPLYFYVYCTKRNKRCLLAYLKHRIDELSNLRWKAGTIIPQDMKLKLSPEELDYFEKYDGILSNYMQSVQLDLSADLEPPKSLYIEVRVLKDYGEILTESGTINLEKDTTHYLRRSDVEHLICQNVLKQISS